MFTGHSSGGPIAILSAIHFLEKFKIQPQSPPEPYCVTFGSPLVGNFIFSHALRRENWAKNFLNLVQKHDIIPRVLLAPLSSIDQQLKQILPEFPKSKLGKKEPTWGNSVAVELYVNVMKNASTVASHAACKLMGNTSLLLETALSFTDLSPYRPFGTYIFFSESGSMVEVQNPDAVLQLLFYSAQLNDQKELGVVAAKSLSEHLSYDEKVQKMEMNNAVKLDDLENIELSPNTTRINSALNDLGLVSIFFFFFLLLSTTLHTYNESKSRVTRNT